jgi:hypothetical protein
VKPRRIPTPMRPRLLRLRPTFLRPVMIANMRLYLAASFFPRRGGRGGKGTASQKANRKGQMAKVKPSMALPFAFCDLHFDLFLHLECTHFHSRSRHDVGKPREE